MSLCERPFLPSALLPFLVGLMYACGPSCPASREIRDDLPATASAGAMTVMLRATRIAQANDSPAVLALRWSPTEESVHLTISDCSGTVLSHPSANGAQRSDGFVLIRALDGNGNALPPGLYEVIVSAGEAKAAVTARFEIAHCALYY